MLEVVELAVAVEEREHIVLVVVVGEVRVRRRIVLGVVTEQTVALLSEVAETTRELPVLVQILPVELVAFQVPLRMAR